MIRNLIQMTVVLLAIGMEAVFGQNRDDERIEIFSHSVIPHVQSHEMHYRRPADFNLGARVQIFIKNTGTEPLDLNQDSLISVNSTSPAHWMESGHWTWHDLPGSEHTKEIYGKLAPGAGTFWTFNTASMDWLSSPTTPAATIRAGQNKYNLSLESPQIYISSVTMTGPEKSIKPDSVVVYIKNDSDHAVRLKKMRLWTRDGQLPWNNLKPDEWIPLDPAISSDSTPDIPPHDFGRIRIISKPLTLGYGIIEVIAEAGKPAQSLHLTSGIRIKKEVFDISGGWVSSNIRGRESLHFEPYLKVLKKMHINTAHIGTVGGYTDNQYLQNKYPLKLFNKLTPIEQFDTDEWLPRIHGVEFIGEPQYGGGTPVPPIEVWKEFAPYMPSRLHTTVTHSEERIWRHYAGLSDYPHYDAYRVCAPAADSWSRYDRWDGIRIRWAAPLETIGTMTRSLRDLNRPAPIAYWSQGAHNGWGKYGGRERTSPTPMELRVQAWQALVNRITSLYWFNLSLPSIMKFPDLIEPVSMIGREIRMMDSIFIEGAPTWHHRTGTFEKPDWDLNVLARHDAALLSAIDLTYQPDTDEKIFGFKAEREGVFEFPVPHFMVDPVIDVKRVDANGLHDVTWEWNSSRRQVTIRDRQIPTVGLYVAVTDFEILRDLEKRRLMLMRSESETGYSSALLDEIRDWQTE